MSFSLAATRSSDNWKSKPGNWDRQNTRAIYPSTNVLGIPDLPLIQAIPASLVPYNSPKRCTAASPGDAVHFFLDDYRFETVWSQPERSLSRIAKVGLALSPDFSLWTQMPLVMQQWQVYRSRWCAMWMIEHGIPCIPTVSWSTEESWDFCFLGIAPKSTVAISTVGINKHHLPMFTLGLEAMLDAVDPHQILVYGRILDVLYGLPVQFYGHRWRV